MTQIHSTRGVEKMMEQEARDWPEERRMTAAEIRKRDIGQENPYPEKARVAAAEAMKEGVRRANVADRLNNSAKQDIDDGRMRNFATGATRDTSEGKPDYEGFLSPLVIERYGEYMNKHRKQADGKLRDSDNWQKGIPRDTYMKSGWRHFFDWWKLHRTLPSSSLLEDALCALLFNVMGYLHEHLAANWRRSLK